MADPQPIALTDLQYNQLMQVTENGTRNFSSGYKLIYWFIESNPDVDSDRKFFFKEAVEINGNDPSSRSNFFIRQITASGLLYDGLYVGDPEGLKVQVQTNSDMMGYNIK